MYPLFRSRIGFPIPLCPALPLCLFKIPPDCTQTASTSTRRIATRSPLMLMPSTAALVTACFYVGSSWAGTHSLVQSGNCIFMVEFHRELATRFACNSIDFMRSSHSVKGKYIMTLCNGILTASAGALGSLGWKVWGRYAVRLQHRTEKLRSTRNPRHKLYC